MRLLVLMAIALLGCGRLGFETVADSSVIDGGLDSAARTDSGAGDDGGSPLLPHCTTNPDADGDGFEDALCPGGTDCDDTHPNIHPGSIEQSGASASCYDRRDNDCDGLVDGAEPLCPNPIFRSVGINASNLVADSASVAIAGGVATFGAPLPDSVGVGDVVEYVAEPVSPAPVVVFIHERLSSTAFRVRAADGALPPDATVATAVSVFRAYVSLRAFQDLDENDSIADGVEDFDRSRDLVSSGTSLHVALYDDGVDRGNVAITSWMTSFENFLRLFTPVLATDVGVSQRHHGRYGTGYRLEGSGDAHTLAVRQSHVRIKGLSVKSFAGGLGRSAIVLIATAPDSHVQVTHCIADGNGMRDANGVIQFQGSGASASGAFYDGNNIVYNAPLGSSECLWHHNLDGASMTHYVYSNTVHGCAFGIEADDEMGRVLARNNIASALGEAFFDDSALGTAFDGRSSGNVSHDATAALIGTALLTSADPATLFESLTLGAEDFHLRADAVAVLDMAADLGSDPSFSIATDVDGQRRPRGPGWDPGADEY